MVRRRGTDELALFEERLVALNRADSTRRLYLGTAQRFLAGLKRPVARAEAGDVLAYLAARRSAGVLTWAQELPRLRSFLRTLVDAGLLAAPVAEGLKLPLRRLATRAALSVESVAELLVEASDLEGRPGDVPRAMSLRDRAAVEMLFGTGLRNSEVCAILVTDLDLASGALRVRPVKRGTPRTLPVPRRAMAHVRRYLVEGRPLLVHEDGRDLGHLLVTKNGWPFVNTYLRDLVVRAANKAGFHAYPHAIRRGLATALVRAGVPLVAVQHQLGHASLQSSERYVATNVGDMRRAIERLDLAE